MPSDRDGWQSRPQAAAFAHKETLSFAFSASSAAGAGDGGAGGAPPGRRCGRPPRRGPESQLLLDGLALIPESVLEVSESVVSEHEAPTSSAPLAGPALLRPSPAFAEAALPCLRARGSHRWQNAQSLPFAQPPGLQFQTHGLHLPPRCSIDPMDGIEGSNAVSSACICCESRESPLHSSDGLVGRWRSHSSESIDELQDEIELDPENGTSNSSWSPTEFMGEAMPDDHTSLGTGRLMRSELLGFMVVGAEPELASDALPVPNVNCAKVLFVGGFLQPLVQKQETHCFAAEYMAAFHEQA